MADATPAAGPPQKPSDRVAFPPPPPSALPYFRRRDAGFSPCFCLRVSRRRGGRARGRHARKDCEPWRRSRLRSSCEVRRRCWCTSGSPPRRPTCAVPVPRSTRSLSTSGSMTTRPGRPCGGSAVSSDFSEASGLSDGWVVLRIPLGLVPRDSSSKRWLASYWRTMSDSDTPSSTAKQSSASSCDALRRRRRVMDIRSSFCIALTNSTAWAVQSHGPVAMAMQLPMAVSRSISWCK